MSIYPSLRNAYRAFPVAQILKRPARDTYEYLCRRTQDAFVLGHPNVGNTMITLALARYFQLHSGAAVPAFFHDTYWKLSRSPGKTLFPPFGKVSSTHLPHRLLSRASDFTYETCVAPYCHAKIILVIRHPLEALLSNWLHYVQNGKAQGLFERPLSKACFDELVLGEHGIPASVAYYNAYAKHRESLKLKLVRFEDCKKGEQSLTKALEDCLLFLSGDPGFKPDADTLRESIRFSSLEKIGENKGTGLYVDDAGSNMAGAYASHQTDLPHQREGHRGPYSDFYLSPSQAQAAKDYVAQTLDPFFAYGETQ